MKNIPSNNPPTRALIVEDSEINAIAARSILKSLNCQADIAKNGNAALEKIDQPYNFIIMDLGLPDADGMQLSLIIHAQSACNATTPIVILTAHGDKKQKEQTWKMGFKGFLYKPLTEELCREMINDFVLSEVSEVDEDYFLEN